MPGWRKFTFLDADPAFLPAAPDALAALRLDQSSCGASHGAWIAFGKPNGTVALVDTGSQATANFRAHLQGVLLMSVLAVSMPVPHLPHLREHRAHCIIVRTDCVLSRAFVLAAPARVNDLPFLAK